MNRSVATAYLTEEFNEVALDAALTSQQVTSAYATAIDNALRQLGYQETDLPTVDVPETQKLAYIALMEYYTVKRFIRIYALKFNVAVTGAVTASRNQTFEMLGKLLLEAESDCAQQGYPVGALAGYFQMGRVTLDYLEPSVQVGTEF